MRRDAPRPLPTATYRFQLTAEQGFAELAALGDHLADLGISHVYLSPILRSAKGSQHGYDVIDHRLVDPELGGEEGLRAAAAHLRSLDIHVLLDLVPNHMALTTPEYLNRALWDALREGPDSPYAQWFDVDWERERPLLMPILGRRIDECLDDEEITIDRTGGPDGEAVVRYYEHVLPVRDGTAGLPLEELLGAQHYRLAYWRTADEELNYRRFFDVDTLLAIRVEEPEVFDATHEVPLRLMADGVVSGLRIDHPDGLADPGGYLQRLSEASGGAWVVVEKILVGDERLPPDWDCDGTTGYEALARVGALFVDPAGEPVLRGSFSEITGVTESWHQTMEQAKRDVMRGLLVAEVDRLARVAYEVCQSEVRLRDHSLRGLRDGLRELLVALPVYRVYVRPGVPADSHAHAVLGAAALRATEARPDRSSEIQLVRDMALGRLGRSASKDEFCRRFQQTCGPVLAKGVEDTAGYRWFPLTSLAEVGGEPDEFGLSVRDFQRWAEQRRSQVPFTLNALSTHDTKRSEDVRARLAALAEVPGEWATAMRAWRDITGPIWPEVADPAAGTGRWDWLAWQTLVGAWPIDDDRLGSYLVKAAREAKLDTSWLAPDDEVESRLRAFSRTITTNSDIVASVSQFVDRLHPAFVANVLGQRAVQLITPGIPDTYQGCEVVSLQLVDPDNRKALDVDRVRDALQRARDIALDPFADLDAAKARLTQQVLHDRRERPERYGPSSPLRGVGVSGAAADHVVALRRSDDVAVVATRFALRLAAGGGWRDTTVELPGRWRCLLTGRLLDLEETTPATSLLDAWPVAVLTREGR